MCIFIVFDVIIITILFTPKRKKQKIENNVGKCENRITIKAYKIIISLTLSMCLVWIQMYILENNKYYYYCIENCLGFSTKIFRGKIIIMIFSNLLIFECLLIRFMMFLFLQIVIVWLLLIFTTFYSEKIINCAVCKCATERIIIQLHGYGGANKTRRRILYIFCTEKKMKEIINENNYKFEYFCHANISFKV